MSPSIPDAASLVQFDIDRSRGFLPKRDPLTKLPARFKAWEDVAGQLPKLLMSDQLRTTVERLPTADIRSLESPQEFERAMMIFSYIGHAYVWCDKSPPRSLPSVLAVPWHATAEKLSRPPVLSYASYALHNWRRIDPKGPVALGNIALLQNFWGGADEEWFILVHVDIEAKSAALVLAVIKALRGIASSKLRDLELALRDLAVAMEAMYSTLARMPEWCDPYIYFHRVRPYIHGWKNHPAFPQGLIYEGVAQYGGKPQQFRGETGAQSAIVPIVDALLGITHADDPLRAYLLEMQDYMPAGHRKFIKTVEQLSTVRDVVTEAKDRVPTLRSAYNQSVDWLAKFRALHLEYAATYIFNQSQKGATNPSAVGTGGTPFMPYLKKHRDESTEHKI